MDKKQINSENFKIVEILLAKHSFYAKLDRKCENRKLTKLVWRMSPHLPHLVSLKKLAKMHRDENWEQAVS